MEQETCRWLAWLPAHALGALDGGDGQALQAHLAAGCARCEAELRALRLDVEALAHAVPAVAPAPATRGCSPTPRRRGRGPGAFRFQVAAPSPPR
jgi:anti-sigma factor RsiW